MVANGYNRPKSGNQVGDPDFSINYDATDNLRLLKMKNALDRAPEVPLHQMGHSDCGVELVTDTNQSTCSKTDLVHRLPEVHSLEVYLHGVAGTQGSRGRFNLEVERSLVRGWMF